MFPISYIGLSSQLQIDADPVQNLAYHFDAYTDADASYRYLNDAGPFGSGSTTQRYSMY
jgi:hypothetical protein